MRFKQHTLAVLFATAFGATAHAGGWVSTETHARPVYTKLGEQVVAAEAAAPSRSLHIAVSLRLRNEADLDARVARIQQGSTTDYISSEKFLASHAPTNAQVQSVVAHLTQAGFRNITVSPNRLLISADGTAASAKLAFNTELHNFLSEGKSVYANVSDVQVPAALGNIVLAVHGLDNVPRVHTMLARGKSGGTSTNATGGSNVAHNPTDFPKIYNASSLAAATGVTVGIISEGDLTQTVTDLNTFTKANGLATVKTSLVNAGSASSDTSGTDEWNLDSQDIVAASGGVKELIFYIASDMSDASLTEAYNAAVSANTAKVINVSLGECETDAKSGGTEASDDAIFKSAIAQGQTFSVSSGDSNSYECGGSSKSVQSYPAVSPYVIAVGGTSLYTSGTTTYSSEKVWDTSKTEGTGGGPSTTELAPSWQTSAGVLGTSKYRGVPDIAFDADPNSGALVTINGTTTGNQIGGTSLASPLFVGFWSRIIQNNGGSLAFPASAFYKYFVASANEKALLHDVTSGNNGGYTAKVGWDYTTGFGSFNVAPLSAFVGKNSGF